MFVKVKGEVGGRSEVQNADISNDKVKKSLLAGKTKGSHPTLIPGAGESTLGARPKRRRSMRGKRLIFLYWCYWAWGTEHARCWHGRCCPSLCVGYFRAGKSKAEA